MLVMVDVHIDAAVLVDVRLDQREYHRHSPGPGLAPVGPGRAQKSHSPTTIGTTGAGHVGARRGDSRWTAASLPRPGGSPLPSCGVSRPSSTVTAVARTRSAVAVTTSTGDLPGTLLAQADTYGTVYDVVSSPWAAPIIRATDSASTSAMPRCRQASGLSGPWSMTWP